MASVPCQSSCTQGFKFEDARCVSGRFALRASIRRAIFVTGAIAVVAFGALIGPAHLALHAPAASTASSVAMAFSHAGPKGLCGGLSLPC